MADLTEDQITPRHLFALVLLHAEIVANQAPATALESYQRDNLVNGAVDMVDRLVERLAEPKAPPPPAPHETYDGWTTPAAQHAAIRRIAKQPDFDELPEFLRTFVNRAVVQINNAEDGIPF